IQHISGANDIVADALSRITSSNSSQRIDLLKLFQLQKEEIDLQHELSSTTNDSVSIDRPRAAYLVGNPVHVDFPSVSSNDTNPTLTIRQATANTHDDTSAVSENKFKTKRSGRKVRFSEHLNDCCTQNTSLHFISSRFFFVQYVI
ncbi:unnamed protein product, partial [Schistosoma mattheei]